MLEPLSPNPSIHFIGIGGAGMSAIARILHSMGHQVSGSDLKETQTTKNLIDEGINVSIGHNADNVRDKNIIVRSTAIPEGNIEIRTAQELGGEVLERAKALQLIASEHKRPIFIAGAHGKTTTTSMVSAALIGAGETPTCVVGGELLDLESNAVFGNKDIFVAEADESDGSFLNYSPRVAVVTNIEGDHYDFYPSFQDIFDAYVSFFGKILPGGCAIVCGDDEHCLAAVKQASEINVAGGKEGFEILTYGEGENCDLRAENIIITDTQSSFDVVMGDKTIGSFTLQVPGRHNIINSLAAVAVTNYCGADMESAISGLAGYTGVKRRFQNIGAYRGATLIDDYAHHPTEVRATISSATARKKGRLIVAFQPHRYSRTKHLATDFGAAFDGVDELILTDVYSAGEAAMPGVTGKLLVDKVIDHEPRTRITYLPRLIDVVDYIRLKSRPSDMIIFMGAGDINVAGFTLAETKPDHQ